MPRYFLNLNIGDFLRDTQALNATAGGAYLYLLMEYTARGKLPTDDKSLCRIARLSQYQWKRYKPILQQYFDDQWRHGRVEIDLAKQARLKLIHPQAPKNRA